MRSMGAKSLGLILVISLAMLGHAETSDAYTANKVWLEARPDGYLRVYAIYTVPELKELRESYVVFTNKQEANKYYWDLIRGADFYPPDPKSRRFIPNPTKPDPW